jgi:hypothetical protein
VFLARFTAVVRSFVPLLAGILRMSSRHFYVANILSALLWAPMHVFPGVLIGLAIAFGGMHAPQLSLAAVGVLILGWIAWSAIRLSATSKAPGRAGQGSRRRDSAASMRHNLGGAPSTRPLIPAARLTPPVDVGTAPNATAEIAGRVRRP